MTVGERVRRVVFPHADVSTADTGLRFTDVLFGFVIFQLFQRLQNPGELEAYALWQVIASTVLVLGSWIGFRRSVNRSEYEVKYFNLPMFRFVLDQLMVILYFRVAVLTPRDVDTPVPPESLVNDTTETLLWVFVLYALWDLGGIAMAHAKDRGKPKYPEIDEVTKEPNPLRPKPLDLRGFAITLMFLTLFGVLYGAYNRTNVGADDAETAFLLATVLLVLYRWFKEIRTSWRADRNPPGNGSQLTGDTTG